MFKVKFSLALLLLSLIVLGCQAPPKKGGAEKVVKVNLGDDPATLDPRLARDTSSIMVIRMFFDGLTRIGLSDEPELALAESYTVSDDLKTYTFVLRSAKWSNGDKVKASDFVYTWRKTLNPKFQSDNAFQLYLIKNGKEVKAGTLLEEQLGVEALDEKTLVVTLENPTPYFLEIISFPVFFPVNPAVDIANPKWAEKEATYVSNGPFILKQWQHHDQIVAEKNPTYWDESQVKIDGVQMVMLTEETEMKLFEKKELHWAGSPLSTVPLDAISTLRKEGHLCVKPIAGTQFIRVNVAKWPLSHPKIRKALALSMDRSLIVEHVTQGGQIPATALVPPHMHDQATSHFSDKAPEQAACLFKEALNELHMEAKDFPSLTLTYASTERNHLIMQAIQEQWRKTLGIEVRLEAMERKVYFSKVAHQDYQLALGSWLADFNDPVNFLEVFKYKTESTNNTNWGDEAYVQLLNESSETSDPNLRFQILGQCEQILMEAMPIIPIFHYTMVYLKDDRLSDVLLSSLGNLDFKWARLDNAK